MVEDHPAGGPHASARHGLLWSEGLSDLALDQAKHQRCEADDLDEYGCAAVVLDEDGVTASRPLKSA